MRTYNYSELELDYLADLAFHDVKQFELRRRNGEEVGNKVWCKIGSELKREFELNRFESDYVWTIVSRMYEDDPELVNQATRFDRRDLPFD